MKRFPAGKQPSSQSFPVSVPAFPKKVVEFLNKVANFKGFTLKMGQIFSLFQS